MLGVKRTRGSPATPSMERLDGVVDECKVGWDSKVVAKGGPDGLVGVIGTASGRSHAVLHVVPRSIVINPCLVLGGRWESRQDVA